MPQLSPKQEQIVWELWLRRVPQERIAKHVGCSRPTVSHAIQRVRAELAEGRQEGLESAREEALATYQLVEREAWSRLAQVTAAHPMSGAYLNAILGARRQADRILGLERITVDHRVSALTKIQEIMETPMPLALPSGAHHGGD